MKPGFRKLPWRLKIKWGVFAFLLFLTINYLIINSIKTHGGLTVKKDVTDKVKADSIRLLKKKIDSLQSLIKVTSTDTIRAKKRLGNSKIQNPQKKI